MLPILNTERMTMDKFQRDYLRSADRTRAQRMRWWHEARFGMFIHWGLYSQLARHEWVMNRERIPLAEYERLADTWHPRPNVAREWAELASKAGMKYMVMTTKHHEGFLLWDSGMSDYNAARRGPGRDLVREYVEAAREFGLRVGFYYSLMDWHHPDGALCAKDPNARWRFLNYTDGCVRELCSNYGKIDILWYDVSWPLNSPEAWDSYRRNAMVRKLQPGIIINNRSQLAEDLGTPEENIVAEAEGRAWEACMTFNGSWGWWPAPPEDWLSSRKVIHMLRTCVAGGGNLLLNVGPKPDGSLPQEATERLGAVGKWMKTNGKLVHGSSDRVTNMEWIPTGTWTRRGNTLYFWCHQWPGTELAIGGLTSRVTHARLYPNGKSLPFEQTDDRLVIRGLPQACPDKVAGIAVVELRFTTVPRQILGAGCVVLEPPASAALSPLVSSCWISKVMPKGKDVRTAKPVSLRDRLNWKKLKADPTTANLLNAHWVHSNADGIVYFANRFQVDAPGKWDISLGHDGGAKVFVDRKPVFADPRRINPAAPNRSRFTVSLTRGLHEIVVAMDTDCGMGWGIYMAFALPMGAPNPSGKVRYPRVVKVTP